MIRTGRLHTYKCCHPPLLNPELGKTLALKERLKHWGIVCIFQHLRIGKPVWQMIHSFIPVQNHTEKKHRNMYSGVILSLVSLLGSCPSFFITSCPGTKVHVKAR